MLEVRLLGKFEVRRDGKSIALPSRPTQSLFAYLILNAGTAYRREKLAGMLWPDSLEETARDNLRHALWRVRKALESASLTRFLHADDLTIKFEASSDYWLDAAALEKVSGNESADELITVLAEYEGELLPGFYDEWVLLEREHLNSVFEHHMARLMSLLQMENRWLDILDWAERWIQLGQKPEPAYRALMSAHAAKGDMSKVAATYERCVKSLSEYGIKPSEQTRLIYENIKSGKERPAKEPPASSTTGALKPKAVARTNLPIPLTSFVGREKQVKEIVRLVGKNRLLTLTGAGGVGKTRLAIESANKVLPQFRDGVWWVDLVALSDPFLLPQAVAQVVNVIEVPNQSITETLIEHFQPRQTLLVLDNCEHLISDCAQLAGRLLSACKHLKILTTSREALDILGETAWPVPSLTLPDIKKSIPANSLISFESIRLFSDRAELVQPGFELNDQNVKAIVRVCHRLSGMPLAIELAAARVKMMSVEEIANHLDDRFDLLTSGSRTVLPRHQTLRATIAWSYDLLSALERILFHRLSVFVGGFTLRAAQEVSIGGSVTKLQVIDLLGQLINKSLVLRDPHSEHSTGETRYGMLETIREYAVQKLDQSGEADEVRNRHLGFFMRLAEQAQPEIFLSSQIAWLDLLEIELDNLRAAMEWSMAADEVERQEAGLRLAAALAWFWERGYRREAIARLKRMLEKMDTKNISPVHTMMFNAIGFLYWSTGEFGQARSYLEKAVSTGRELGKSFNLAWALNYLGATALAQGDQQTAQLYLDEAFEMAMGLGPAGKHVVGWALAFLGDSLFLNRDFAKAQSMYEMSMLALGEVGNLNLKAYPLRRLGYLALYHGDLKNAKKFFKESLGLNYKLKHQLGSISCVAAFAGLAIAEQNYLRSAKLLGAVEANLEAMAQFMLPSDRFEYSHNTRILRKQLDQQVLQDAWKEGRALLPDQVVEFALAT
jgi:predicted ATPase/DNA-binding SARP family transcriptional activator